MNQWEFKKDYATNVHQFISNHVFFHDQLLERWLKLCSYEIISRDIGFELSSNNVMHAEAVIKTLDNVFIIFDNEVRMEMRNISMFMYTTGIFLENHLKKNY